MTGNKVHGRMFHTSGEKTKKEVKTFKLRCKDGVELAMPRPGS